MSLSLTTRNLLPSSPFIPDIEQDAPDSFFMTTRRQAINADCMVASNIIFSGDNDCVGCRYLCYLLTQEVEQLSFVVTVSQEVLPVSGDFALVFVTLHLTPCPLFVLVSAVLDRQMIVSVIGSVSGISI